VVLRDAVEGSYEGVRHHILGYVAIRRDLKCQPRRLTVVEANELLQTLNVPFLERRYGRGFLISHSSSLPTFALFLDAGSRSFHVFYP
jgi:hypothetical protein